MRVRPRSPLRRSGLKPCATFIAPSSRITIASSEPPQRIFSNTPKPPMLVPEPGMNSVVVTPPAAARRIISSLGRTTSSVRSSAFNGMVMSLMSPPPPLTWWCRSTKPGLSQSAPWSSRRAPAGTGVVARGPNATILPPCSTSTASSIGSASPGSARAAKCAVTGAVAGAAAAVAGAWGNAGTSAPSTATARIAARPGRRCRASPEPITTPVGWGRAGSRSCR